MYLNGWRGAGLLLASLLSCLPRGIYYTLTPPDLLAPGLEDLALGGEITRVLGIMWLVAATLGAYSAFQLKDLPGIFALAFMHALWAAALLLGWVLGLGGTWLYPLTMLGLFGLIVCWSRMVNPPHADVDALFNDRGTASG